jgi:hypothetical protein
MDGPLNGDETAKRFADAVARLRDLRGSFKQMAEQKRFELMVWSGGSRDRTKSRYLQKTGVFADSDGDFRRNGMRVCEFGSSEAGAELQKPANSGLFCALTGGTPVLGTGWLRREDSNLRMVESKSADDCRGITVHAATVLILVEVRWSDRGLRHHAPKNGRFPILARMCLWLPLAIRREEAH